jgi:LysR family transcriptional regulator, hydrogen peroxide-inducible genes activator
MTLTELRYLTVLGREQHFGRAAEACGVSQPSMSMAIRNLEKSLGVLLFERSKSGISPTDMGTQLIAQAGRVLAQVDAITALARADKDQLNGSLRLGAPASLAPYLFPPLIPQLRLMAPGLELALSEANTADLAQQLREGLLDAVLVTQPLATSEVVVQELYREPLVAVMPANHALAARRQLTAEDLSSQTLLLPPCGSCLRDQLLVLCPDAVGRPGSIDTSSLETLRHMVAIGLGVSLLPLSATASAVYSGLVARSLQPTPTRSVSLAWRTSFPRHKAIDLVRRAIQTCSWQFTTGQDDAQTGLLVDNNSW